MHLVSGTVVYSAAEKSLFSLLSIKVGGSANSDYAMLRDWMQAKVPADGLEFVSVRMAEIVMNRLGALLGKPALPPVVIPPFRPTRLDAMYED